MLVTVHQPNYLPWPGFFHKWMLADAFVVLDTVQFSKNDWQNRNRIKTVNGAQWLSVPVHYHFPALLTEVGISSGPWARKHQAAINQAYAKTPFFTHYRDEISTILTQPWHNLSALNISLIRLLGSMLGCKAPLYVASEMQTRESDPSRRLVDICRELGATAYLSGIDGKKYLQIEPFRGAGIDLWFQDVQAPVYPQLHGEFVSHLSVVDLLFNVGPEAEMVIREMGGRVQ